MLSLKLRGNCDFYRGDFGRDKVCFPEGTRLVLVSSRLSQASTKFW